MAAKSFSEKIKGWIPTILLLSGYVFSMGIGWGKVDAHDKKLAKLEKDSEDLKRIQAEQHTLQRVQAEQMKWIIDSLKKKQ